MEIATNPHTRCAIYTRKSSARGLEQHVTSMEAQRDVCSAYIKCNAHRGWVELEDRYDDGGFTGATLARPALQLLLQHIIKGKVDVVLFYKIDRLTRSLADFVRLLDVLKRYEVSFVSVTQSFDTSETIGRLVLNILLTFAQFEREMLSDRIRDKLSAMRRRGIFVSGHPPLGYDKRDGKLIVNEAEALTVRRIFERVGDYPKTFQLLKALRSEGVRTKAVLSKSGRPLGGTLMHVGSLYHLLRNPLYIGLIRDGDSLVPAVHTPIVDPDLFDEVQMLLRERGRRLQPWDSSRNILRGLLYDHLGRAMHFSCGGSGPRRCRFYSTARRGRKGDDLLRNVRVAAQAIEDLVFAAFRTFVADPSQLLLTLQDPFTRSSGRKLAQLCRTTECRISQMNRTELRQAYLCCICRIEIRPSKVRIDMFPSEIRRLLLWDGMGTFPSSDLPGRIESEHHVVDVPANILSAAHMLPPILSLPRVCRRPDARLVRLLSRAFNAREALMHGHDRSYGEIAGELGVKPTGLTRLVRLTYLAPDIQACIYDGSHPQDLTANKLLRSPLPLDWEQQRIMLGFRGAIPSAYAEHTRVYL